MPHTWTQEEARHFQLGAVGLLGARFPPGEEGIRQALRDLRGVQLDPLPLLGRNHDLVIQARVDGTHPGQLLELAHRERLGFEYWDKALCLVPIDAYPAFRPRMEAGGNPWELRREAALEREHPGAIDEVYAAIREHGPLSATELRTHGVAQDAHLAWKATHVAGGALEVLWNRGRLAVSHRVHHRRYFDLTERVIPNDMLARTVPSLEASLEHLLRKRVDMVGLLPARGDLDAWASLRAARDAGLPERMVEEGKLSLVHVEGFRTPLYAPPEAAEQLATAHSVPRDSRARFIAPLDPLLWCRNVLKHLWDFTYVWEVYKPQEKRRWGYYVLPVLHDGRFVARFDGRYESKTKTLQILGYWQEPNGLPRDHPAIVEAFARFLEYLGGETIR